MTRTTRDQTDEVDQPPPSSFEGEVHSSRSRRLPKSVSRVLNVLMFLYAIYFVYAAGFEPLPGIEHRAIHLAGGFIFALLLFAPAKRLVDSRWALLLDILLVVATVAGSAYVFNTFETYSERVGLPATVPDIIFGVVIFAIMFEVSRRVIDLAFPIVTAAFVAYAFLGPLLPVPFTHAGYSVPRFVATFFYTLNGPYGEITQISANYILIFIIFAAFVLRSGAGEFIRDLALVALGKVRGGPGKIAVVASSLMGMLTGSSLANVASVGSITIPMMKRAGYRANFAGGVEATSGMGAQIMPPVMGGSVFIMMEILGIPYWDIASSAFLIGALFYLSLFFMVDLEAAKRNLHGLRSEEIPRLWPVVKGGWYNLIPIAVLVYMLAVIQVSPARAAFWGIVTTMLVMLVARRSTRTLIDIAETMVKGVRDALLVISIVAMASLIAGIVTVTGLGINLSSILIDIAGGNLLLLLIIAAVASLIIGTGAPILVSYAVLAVLVAPALIDMSVSPLAAHLFIFYFAIISAITPPVAPDAFVAAGIARSSPLRTANQAMRIAGALYLLPFLFVYNEVLLLEGPLSSIGLAGLTAALGIYSLTCAFQGVLLPKLFVGWWARILLGVAGLGLIVPNLWYSLMGLAVVIVVHAWYFLRRKRKGEGTEGGREGTTQDASAKVEESKE
jgi:TRAP transporter 4TM/12TM fusion protein